MEVSGQFHAQFSLPVGKTVPVPNWLGCIGSQVTITKITSIFHVGNGAPPVQPVLSCTAYSFESVMSQNNEYHSLLKIQEKVAGSFISLT
jgi:hypothetical protein